MNAPFPPGSGFDPARLRDTVGRSWWVILLFGVFSVLFGIMAFANPLAAGAGLTWAIGLLALAEGVVGLIGAFGKDAGVNRGWMILYAAISIIFGLLAVINPLSMATSIAMVMGIWFIVSGVMRVIWAIRVRKEIDNEWLLILGGVLGIALGILLVMAPVAGVLVGTIWIGAGALIYGALQIWAAFKVRKLNQR
ncbi:HdeD family acid-resistance protein [Diaphorobacter sp.]|uniref:HdeD family acid-resistance protein n=1 Tax=Diaphorobacter sp. TaxID=1934310 RepID=UPI0028B21336|nr:HdeD family acid-resistance protein [Diaphorobacter sp.]